MEIIDYLGKPLNLDTGGRITWRDVPGWFDFMDLYDEVAMTTPPYSTIVEVGVCFGKSLLYLAQKIRESGKDIKLVAVDGWRDYPGHKFIYNPEDSDANVRAVSDLSKAEQDAYAYARKFGGTYQAFMHNLRASGFADMVQVIRSDSAEAASLFGPGKSVSPYFVFIDADHEYAPVKADIDAWWATGPEWMAGHDYNRGSAVDFPGVWQAVHDKWGQSNVGWRNHTCWTVRRSHLERPDALYRLSPAVQETMTAREYAERP